MLLLSPRRLWPAALLACVVGVAGLQSIARAQTSPSGSGARVPGVPLGTASETGTDGGRIEGRVLAGDSGRPLRRAQVRLAAADSRLQRVASTDDQGRFSFGSLPAGRYALSASKTGYVPLEYGQSGARQGGRIIRLTTNQRRDGADIRLPPGSVITVRVTDRFGEPLAGAGVEVQQFGYSEDGLRTLVQVSTSQSARAVTNDRGEARLYGLMPGDYVLSATPPQPLTQLPDEANDAPITGYAPTFYPGTTSAGEASTVAVGTGQEAWAQIPLVPARLATVSGTVVDSTGLPSVGSTVRVASAGPAGTNVFAVSRRGTTTDRNGAFVLDGVRPGDHVVVVSGGRGGRAGRGGRGGRGGARASDPETAAVPVTISGHDIEGLYVVTGPTATIAGRVRSIGAQPFGGEETFRPRIRVREVNGSLSGIPGISGTRSATVAPDGTFTVDRVVGRVLVDVSLPEGWMLLSVTMAGRDVTDTPLDLAGVTRVSDLVVTITDAVTQVSGSVHDGRGLPVGDGVVVLQPAGRLDPVAATRRTRAIRLDEQGQFETTGLRPGPYVATAVYALESGAERSPDVRERLARRGRSFTLRQAERTSLTLEIGPEP